MNVVVNISVEYMLKNAQFFKNGFKLIGTLSFIGLVFKLRPTNIRHFLTDSLDLRIMAYNRSSLVEFDALLDQTGSVFNVRCVYLVFFISHA